MWRAEVKQTTRVAKPITRQAFRGSHSPANR
jgi:hypothetical protein